jgi:hypothetical protein
MPDKYRSYVVRVRRSRDQGDAVRLEVEDLLGGARSTLRGPAADDLSLALDAALSDPNRPTTPGPSGRPGSTPGGPSEADATT